MPYRSERFSAGDLLGLEQAWSAIDNLEASGLPVVSEVMAGESYRRQLHPETAAQVGNVHYLLQAVVELPERQDGKRVSARYFVDESNRVLSNLDLPGEPEYDEGGLHGLDPSTTRLAFGSTGRTEDDVLTVYAPWVSTRWKEAGKNLMFFCGIELPKPKRLMEDYPIEWDVRLMRRGLLVFKPTPANLTTH